MEIEKTAISEIILIKPSFFKDERGTFFESFNIGFINDLGINFSPVQENCIYSTKKGTVRGVHFQNSPFAQAKLVRCTKGRVLDFAIDLRKNSPTFLKHVSVELDSEKHYQLYIPEGFGHLVLSLTNDSIVEYFVNQLYSPENDRSINCLDQSFNIEFPFKKLIMSEKDKKAPFLKDSDCNFVFKKEVL